MKFMNEREYFTGMFVADESVKVKNATRLWKKPRQRLMKE
jgi:hypothetical protein